MENKDAPLRRRVEGDMLTVDIGVETLRLAAEHCPSLYDGTVENCDPPYCKVADVYTLAKDVGRYLFKEREDGSSLISDALDCAIVDALEDGSEAFACVED